MKAATVVTLLAVGCAPSQADKDAERIARVMVAGISSEQRGTGPVCRLNGMLRQAGGIVSPDAESTCDREKSDAVKAEKAYRAACERCATAEKCEQEIRHIRQVGQDAMNETACP